MVVVASLQSFVWILPQAPIQQPPSVYEPVECRLFVPKAPNVDPVPSRMRFDVLLGESEFLGIARQCNPVFRHLAKLPEVVRGPVLLDFEYGPRGVDRYEDLRAPVLARLGHNSGKSLSRFLSRLPVEQIRPEIARLDSNLT